MTPEAQDFRAECDQIRDLLIDHDATVFNKITLFKNWTIGDIVGHLHAWNIAADLSLNAPVEFQNFVAIAMGQLGAGKTHPEFQRVYFAGKTDAEIFADWTGYYPDMAKRFEAAEADQRVKWVGPDMSVRSSIIARQMEHWAHAQAIFDVLGVDRRNTDRLKNVAHIGVTTFSWSFRVRGQTPPSPKPYVKLSAPSGDIWTWNDAQSDNCVEGTAEAFCQVVTQCRNVQDTDLVMTGEIAHDWMAHAQCFAGGAETPPEKGLRRKAV
ncbi:TIGR03084 family protein [Litorimonas cladophorae]|uniref:TIGR03084 family protein n=1 Tax=Litorimonas cladophorae TaxID=1220491 RepID=A0A918KTJ2_9PROT|nr:TIGR03084 family metal-binding protein [Litorimonas cladophorae]GGX73810.1 TIGR03084 family protein [Litorimonas cladophorae]